MDTYKFICDVTGKYVINITANSEIDAKVKLQEKLDNSYFNNLSDIKINNINVIKL